jgi:hypothetical protein
MLKEKGRVRLALVLECGSALAAGAAPLSHVTKVSLYTPCSHGPLQQCGISHGDAFTASKCANALRLSDQQLRPVLADMVDGVLHLALDLEVSKAAMGGNLQADDALALHLVTDDQYS